MLFWLDFFVGQGLGALLDNWLFFKLHDLLFINLNIVHVNELALVVFEKLLESSRPVTFAHGVGVSSDSDYSNATELCERLVLELL